jgi:hypothetical protein
VPTKAEIIAKAVDAGYGRASALERRFERFQEVGYIGEAMQRHYHAPAEWHAVNAELFLDALSALSREDKATEIELAIKPLVMWLRHSEGISSRHARRAFRTCIEELTTTRSGASYRSKDYKEIQKAATLHSAPGARPSDRNRLKRALWTYRKDPVGTVRHPENWIAGWAGASTSSERKVDPAQGRVDAELSIDGLAHLVGVASFIEAVCDPGMDNDELWEWARRFVIQKWDFCQSKKPELLARHTLGFARVSELDADEEFTLSAVMFLAIPFGFAILRRYDDRPWNENWELPPPYPILAKAVDRRIAERGLLDQ